MLERVLELPPSPLANAFQQTRELALALPKLQLNLQLCLLCGHIQLEHVVEPSTLFTDYVYASGTAASFRKHFDEYAAWAMERFKLQPNQLVVEIGSNDGTLLEAFKHRGLRVLGVEPGQQLAKMANERGLSTVCDYWSPAVAHALYCEHGPAALIVANNVFAHIPDLGLVLDGVNNLLARDGAFVFEVQYVRDLFEKHLFDMIYHEHMHYHSVRALARFLGLQSLPLRQVLHQSTHGGSLRCVTGGKNLGHAAMTHELIHQEVESELFRPSGWAQLGASVHALKWQLKMLLEQYQSTRVPESAPLKLVAFGAPAKATTLLHTIGVLPLPISYIVDDSPLKQGLFAPGTGLEVRPPSALEQEDPASTVLLILAWNFAEEIQQHYAAFHAKGGRFLVPLPVPKLV